MNKTNILNISLRVVILESINIDDKLKLRWNKANGQVNVSLSKQQFPQLNNKQVKFIRVKGELEFLE